jgi:hypothetical protein
MSSTSIFNWEDFGELRVASASEDDTVRALTGNGGGDASDASDAGDAGDASDAGREMFSPVRPHLFLMRPVNTSAYFTFIVSRWRNNVERRNRTEPGFTLLQAIGDTVFEWLMRLEKCVTVKCMPEADITSVVEKSQGAERDGVIPVAVLPNEVFERLRRVFRLLVFRTNCLNAELGYAFQTTGPPETGHLNFYTKHRFDGATAQKQFMSRKRKQMSTSYASDYVDARVIM